MRRGLLLGLACALILIAVFAARPAATPGPLLRDFEAYWSAGSTWNEHGDPYGRDIWRAERGVPGVDASRDEILPFVGPPAQLLLWSPLARLSYDAASRLWWVVLGLGLLALVAVVIRAAAESLTAFSFFAGLTLAVAFGPVTSDLALGQIAIIALLGATFLCHPELCHPERERSEQSKDEGRLLSKAFAAFVAFFQPNVAIGLVSQLGRNRSTVALAIGAVVTYLAGALASGWSWPVTYAQHLALHQNVERFSAIQLTPTAIAYGFGASPAAAAVTGAVIAIVAVVAAIVMWVRVADRFARFAAFAALAPFVAGFFHEHDLIVAYVAALWCAIRTRGIARTIALAGTLLVAIDWLGLAQRPTGIAQSALLATAALFAFTALGEMRRNVTLAAAAPVTALFVYAALLGGSHPSPVWPDALGSFRAQPGASIATVWLQEQRANGLLAATPVWSFLRGLSLLGCSLLAAAIYLRPSCCRTASGCSDGNS